MLAHYHTLLASLVVPVFVAVASVLVLLVWNADASNRRQARTAGEVDHLRTRLDGLAVSLAETGAVVQILDDAYDVMDSRANSLANQVDVVEAKVDQHQGRVCSLNNRVVGLESREFVLLKQRTNSIGHLESDVAEMRASVGNLKQRVDGHFDWLRLIGGQVDQMDRSLASSFSGGVKVGTDMRVVASLLGEVAEGLFGASNTLHNTADRFQGKPVQDLLDPTAESPDPGPDDALPV